MREYIKKLYQLKHIKFVTIRFDPDLKTGEMKLYRSLRNV